MLALDEDVEQRPPCFLIYRDVPAKMVGRFLKCRALGVQAGVAWLPTSVAQSGGSLGWLVSPREQAEGLIVEVPPARQRVDTITLGLSGVASLWQLNVHIVVGGDGGRDGWAVPQARP